MRISFRTQIVGSTVLLVAGVMIALLAGTQAVLEFTAHRDIDRALKVRISAARTLLDEARAITQADVEPGTRVYDARGRVVGGSIERDLAARADRLAASTLADGRIRTASAPRSYQLRAAPFVTDRGERGVVVVTQDGAPYEQSERYALIATIVLGGVVVALAAGGAWLVTRRALRPVRQMAERAADWSEHDLSHRFALGPPTNELAALGETLDHLLDRVAMAIRSEQRLTSELAHELRTPLTAVQGTAELALMRSPDDPAVREDLTEIVNAARRMSDVIGTLLELARSPEQAITGPHTDLADAIASVAPLVPAPLTLATDLPTECPPAAAPEDLVVRALAPIVENAAQHACTAVTIAVRVAGDRLEVTVTDDGPGVPDDVRDRLFEPGASGRGGTGLGLGIARRVARSLAGDVAFADGTPSAFVLRLPRG